MKCNTRNFNGIKDLGEGWKLEGNQWLRWWYDYSYRATAYFWVM